MTSSRSAALILFLASIAVVGAALFSQYVGGLQPCELCLLERWPYYTMIVLMALALMINQPGISRGALAWAVLIFLISTGLGLYHVGVEQHFIQGPTACTSEIGGASSPEALLRALEGRQPVQCDVVQWSFMGISLAGLNVIVSLVLTVFALWSFMRLRAEKI
jgi:disulfide bond formation protein DsbB